MITQDMYDAIRTIYQRRGRILPFDGDKPHEPIDFDTLNNITEHAGDLIMQEGFKASYTSWRDTIKTLQEDISKEVGAKDPEAGNAIASYNFSDDELYKVLMAAFKENDNASES